MIVETLKGVQSWYIVLIFYSSFSRFFNMFLPFFADLVDSLHSLTHFITKGFSIFPTNLIHFNYSVSAAHMFCCIYYFWQLYGVNIINKKK